jgi:metal iron transporter
VSLGLVSIVGRPLSFRHSNITLDLATNCRLLLYSRPKNTRLWRWGVLYPLYLLAEVAIISTDLAELLGSAIALCMLFPALPLWGGVLLTASDVLILLAIGDPLRGRPVKLFEWTIGALVSFSTVWMKRALLTIFRLLRC